MEAFCAAKGMESPFAGGRPGQGVPKGPKACPLTRALGGCPPCLDKERAGRAGRLEGRPIGPWFPGRYA